MTEAQVTGKALRRMMQIEARRPDLQFIHTDFSDLIKSAEFLESLFPNWVFLLCKIHHAQLPYVSDNCLPMLGYTSSYLKSLSPEEYFRLVHPDDAKSVRMVFEYMHNWSKKSGTIDPNDYRLVFHYRIKTPGRGYAYLLDEKHVFRNKSGQYIYFSLIKNITTQQPFTHVKVEIYKRYRDDYRKIDEYVPRTKALLPITSREKEILQCIQAGMTSKQIAEKLSVSIFTVRNHRSHIFEKTQAQNMVQLIKHAEASGWI
jgi:DNA-binding CsgD family transcriptional regulator